MIVAHADRLALQKAGDGDLEDVNPELRVQGQGWDAGWQSSLEVAGALAAFEVMAVTQPLFDLLGRSPEFFIARHSPILDIIVFAVVTAVGIPLILWAMVMGLSRLSRRAGTASYLVITSLLGGFIFLRIMKQGAPGSLPDALVLILAALAGGALAWAVKVRDSFRSVLRLGVLLPLLIGGWFLLATPVAKLVFPVDVELGQPGRVDRPANVVLLVFDELPLPTILNKDGGIDRVAFPNFARIARSATWYRNATIVSKLTSRAVPAILSGQYPGKNALPTAADYPHNIFTLLGSRYRMEAEELITRLCPEQVCDETTPPIGTRMGSLGADVSLIAAHMLLPEILTRGLPPVDENWGDFAGQVTPAPAEEPPGLLRVALGGDPASEFKTFIDGIRSHEEPTLYFKHVLLPHVPWRYLPNGQQYPQGSSMPGELPMPGGGERWTDDGWLVAQGYQRHILQTMLVDRLLGRLLDRLHEEKMYRDSVIVVVADHGVSFVPGEERRSTIREAIGSVAPVPLFVKAPGQVRGAVVDAPVQTIDILPTIAALIGAQGLWDDIDGEALSEGVTGTTDRKWGYSDAGYEKNAVVRRKLRLFGATSGGLDPYLLAPAGTRSLLGSGAPASPRVGDATFTLEGAEAYDAVDLRGPFLPAVLRGGISAPGDQGGMLLAVTLNGTVAAVTRGFERSGDAWRFTAMLPARFFKQGRNEIGVYLLEDGPQGPLLVSAQPE